MSFMMYVVRHGQPAKEEDGYTVKQDPQLSDLGLEQADCVAEQFERWGGLDAIYSSSLLRAMQTAQPIYHRLQVPWHVWPSLCETGRREWPLMRKLQGEGGYETHLAAETMKRHGLNEHYPSLTRLQLQYPGIRIEQPYPWPEAWYPELAAETRERCYDRAERSIAAICESHMGTEARVAVVCHGAFGSVLMNALLSGTPCDHIRFHQAHAAISLVEVADNGTAALHFLNHVNHMPLDKITEGSR
ncbi:histidine phosphatase family protein [Paenibacillus sp. J5C_2022]|uniref:histidine phosphatase family protein n=1 Tax=Paenibacillus sp. J5C2022 TaxID=2977129 RepID=UPI0021D0B082|nr:histidine phosphatase family protein [Paenibacillus sp. J5C2022]MCU6712753.1 histidine phosphatase family protein [Paenibacillus sp. J5C2022]